MSVKPSAANASTVHSERQCSSVIEIDGWLGIAWSMSRAPQYLTKAMFDGA